jgi:hypothetical protein
MTTFKLCLQCNEQTPDESSVCQHCGAQMPSALRPRTLRRIVLFIGLAAILTVSVALLLIGPR